MLIDPQVEAAVFIFLGHVAGRLKKQLGSLPLQSRKDRSPEEATGFTAKGTEYPSSSKNQNLPLLVLPVQVEIYKQVSNGQQ